MLLKSFKFQLDLKNCLQKKLKKIKNNYVVGFFYDLKFEHISKDVCQIPFFIGRKFNLPSIVVSLHSNAGINNYLIENIKHAKIDRINILIPSKQKRLRLLKIFLVLFLIKNARRIKVFYLYQFSFNVNYLTIFLAILFKIFNPNGILHIRWEADFAYLNNYTKYKGIKGFFITKYYRIIDIFGVIATDEKIDFITKNFGIPAKNIKMQFNGFNSKEILNKVRNIKSFKDRLDIITLSGRLDDKLKGLDVFLRAINEIDLGNWKIHLYGGDPKKIFDILKNYLNKSHMDKVFVFGRVSYEELYNGLNNSKVYIVSSYVDGMPLAAIEAMALGNIIISAKHYGMMIALQNGKIGKLFKIGDYKELGKIIYETINDNSYLEETFIKSLSFAWKNFSWENIIKQIYCL